MTISSGTLLGPYEILAPIGSGGMGEVFKARDTRLERIVAIKILPQAVSSDEGKRTRFRREAKIISQLNHPHICTLHDAGSENGIDFLVMEHIEGHSLAERLTRGALPLDEVLRIGIEIAGALQRAHEQRIVHRDLKPSNIMLTKSGVKLLDFGLARFVDGQDSTVTADGVIAGTPRYMAPEQIDGLPSDRRADIFALGCVLYEMRSGKPALGGVQRVTPPELDHVIAKCLQSDPDRRWQDARDIAEELRWIGESAAGRRSRWKRPALVAMIVLAVAAVLASLALLRARRQDRRPLRATFTRLTNAAGIEEFPAISPDGKFVAYESSAAGNPDIYLLRIGGQKVVNLTADSKMDEGMPAFSPDGQLIAFRSGRDGGGIFVMGATGESVKRVSYFGFNPAWSPDGEELVVSSDPGNWTPYKVARTGELWRIDVATGRKRPVLLGRALALTPTWSPHGDRIAYCRSNQGDILSVPRAGGPATVITSGPAKDWSPVWSSDGFIYFSSNRGGGVNLWRIAVDEATGNPRGEPEAVTTPSLWSGPLGVSADGKRIVYCARVSQSKLLRISFDPVREQLVGAVRQFSIGNYVSYPDLSPDGRSIAFSTQFEQEDIYVVGSDGDGGDVRKLTDDVSSDVRPRWSPDGKRIAFTSNRAGVSSTPQAPSQVWAINADGSGLQQLTDLPGAAAPVWSPDGRRMAVRSNAFQSLYGVVDLTGPIPARSGKEIPVPPYQQRYEGLVRAWSPDGKWLVGVAGRPNFTDRFAFVYSLDTGAYHRIQALQNLNASVCWMSDSRRILLLDAGKFSVVDAQTSAARLIDSSFPGQGMVLSKDDRSIYFVRETDDADIWLAELK